MPERVKCLHVLIAHSLAKGPGVNPLGDEALAVLADEPAMAGILDGRWSELEGECEQDRSRTARIGASGSQA